MSILLHFYHIQNRLLLEERRENMKMEIQGTRTIIKKQVSDTVK